MISLQHTNDRRSRWQKSLRHEAAVAAAVGRRAAVWLGLILALSTDLVGAAEFKIGYLRVPDVKKAVSPRDVPADDNGLAGAKLAIADNNTTGRFLDQRFSLQDVSLEEGQDAAAAAGLLRNSGISLVIADLPGDDLLKAADANRDILFFNAGALDDRLRGEDCRANVIHTAPTRSMFADALAQYLAWKKWRRWLLVAGSHERDRLFADALKRAAARFGAKVVQERTFEDAGGARRTDSGITQIQRRIPVFTQSAPEYDVLVAADESEVFAAYLPYHTWDARPVAGSAGLMPKSWDAAHEQWGASQLQSRFVAMFSRPMTERDWNAWAAARMIGEAAARGHGESLEAMIAFFKSPEFSLAAFKGQRLTLRDWNLQLRQPILLTDGRIVVSVSPQEGFLHQVSDLDTLGYDRPETKCKLK
jgi:ABC transporter substrate binding protein (PQQ-dependent alcohol dehydrogenase system)